MNVYQLNELNNFIRQVVALNFAQPLWIEAEIAQANRSRGHLYLDLVQKGDNNEPLAQAQGVLWENDYRKLRISHGLALDQVLREGVALKMQVRVEFHERYGLKLHLVDIDPAYTLGQLALQRRQTLATLEKEGLLALNRQKPLPHVLQRIAVVSSEGAAGWQDFREHLVQNAFGYQFYVQFFQSAVQGRNAEIELIAALQTVALRHDKFDAVVIVRGGGARLDLAAFDTLELGRKVAAMPLPVLVGIGHDVDETVLDLVAHQSLKTPTAVADFLVQHNLFFENEILRSAETLQRYGMHQLNIGNLELERQEQNLRWGVREKLQIASQNIKRVVQMLPVLTSQTIQNQRSNIDRFEALCAALHPSAILSRGFSITRFDGKIVTNPNEIPEGGTVQVQLKDGELPLKRTKNLFTE